MKAAVLRGIENLNLEDIDDPKIKDNEVLITVKACGICGTDIEMYEGRNKEGTFPFVPGHEWAGEVIDIGSKVKTIKIGDHVVAEPFLPCGVCHVCKDGQNAAFCTNPLYYGFTWQTPGGMADLTKAEEMRVHKMPENISFEEGALIDPLSVAYHGIWGIGGGVAAHDTVLVLGGGPVGLMALAVSKVAGASTIVVEPIKKRLELAKRMGAELMLNPKEANVLEEVRSYTNGIGPTLIVEASGSDQAIMLLMDIAAKSSRVILIGHSIGRQIPMEIGKAIWKGLTIFGACDSPHIVPKTLRFLSRRMIDVTPIISHRFPLSRVVEAFELGVKREESSKILVIPNR